MKKFVVSLLFVLLCSSVLAGTYKTDTEALQKHSLLNLVDESTLVVVGTVQHKNYVYREGVLPDGSDSITTDIIVRVGTMIKGTPNFGENYVKFMIRGGVYFSEREGTLMRLSPSSQPTFEVGEQVMLFVATPTSPDSYHRNYPHGGLHLIYTKRGKKTVADNAVRFTYVRAENSGIAVKFPLALAVNLAKASVRDKDATIPLENQIKALATGHPGSRMLLPDTLVDSLTTATKQIIEEDD